MLYQYAEARSLTFNRVFEVLASMSIVSHENRKLPRVMWHENPACQDALGNSSDQVSSFIDEFSGHWRVATTKIEPEINSTTQPTTSIPNSYNGKANECLSDDGLVPHICAYLDINSVSNQENVACNMRRSPDLDNRASPFPIIDVTMVASQPASPHHIAGSPESENMAPAWSTQPQAPFSLAAIEGPHHPASTASGLPPRRDPHGRRLSPTQAPAAVEPNASPSASGPSGRTTSLALPAQAPASTASKAFDDVGLETTTALACPDRGDTLLRRAARHGWDFPDLRRLYTLGYSPEPVWRLLASLPPSLRAAIRDAVADCAGVARGVAVGRGRGAGRSSKPGGSSDSCAANMPVRPAERPRPSTTSARREPRRITRRLPRRNSR